MSWHHHKFDTTTLGKYEVLFKVMTYLHISRGQKCHYASFMKMNYVADREAGPRLSARAACLELLLNVMASDWILCNNAGKNIKKVYNFNKK